jgi:hypothetical protein
VLKLGCFSWFSACAFSVIKIGSEDMSKYDFTTAKSLEIPFVAQKSTRSGSYFILVGEDVRSPLDSFFVDSFHRFEYFVSSGCNEFGSPSQYPQHCNQLLRQKTPKSFVNIL